MTTQEYLKIAESIKQRDKEREERSQWRVVASIIMVLIAVTLGLIWLEEPTSWSSADAEFSDIVEISEDSDNIADVNLMQNVTVSDDSEPVQLEAGAAEIF